MLNRKFASKKCSFIKGLFTILVLLLLTVLLSGACGRQQEGEKEPPQLRGSITISGSGTTIPIMEILSQAFAAKNPGVEFNILPSSHTAGGIEGTVNGVLDIGPVSRYLEASEKHPDIEEFFFCKDALVFATHRNTVIEGLSREQILDIYRGKIKNWQDVGGPPGPIIVINRPDHSSPKIILDDALFGKNFPFSSEQVIIERAEDANTATVETTNAIGFTSLGMIIQEHSKVNVIPIDGFAPNEVNVHSGNYPFFRPLGFVYRRETPAHVKAFIDYIGGEESRALMLEHGYFPEK